MAPIRFHTLRTALAGVLAFPALVPGADAAIAFPFPVPTATITIDGLADDWTGITPLLDDPQGDSSCATGSDIRSVYLARDADFLYWRIDTWSGTFFYGQPDSGPMVLVKQVRGGIVEHAPGDIESRIFSGTSGRVSRWDGTAWNTLYSGAAYGLSDQVAEGKIPLPVFDAGEFIYMDTFYFLADGTDCDIVDAARPRPDVKANGGDGPVVIPAGDPLQVTVSLTPGIFYDGVPGDWWMAAIAPAGVYWYTLDSGWVLSPAPLPAWTGPLVDVMDVPVLDTTSLPPGTYNFLFGAEDAPDGKLQPMYLDLAPVRIQ